MATARPKIGFLAGPRFGRASGPRFVSQAPPDLDAFVVDAELPDEEKIRLFEGVQVLVTPNEGVDFGFLRSCPSVKLIQSGSAGNDLLDLKLFAELGLPVADNGGANANAMAEKTIGLMLGVCRNLMNQWHNVHKDRRWNEGLSRPPGIEITGRTVGIIGLGRIGKNVARLLRGFDTRTIYYDSMEVPKEVQEELKAEPASFEAVLSQSDFVTLHVALTSSTRRLIGQRELGMMRPDAYLINTCRGEVVDEPALYRALTDKTIAGAALDVTDPEPPSPDNPLFDLDNVVITPHSGATIESQQRQYEFIFGNIRRVLAGEPPLSVITGED